MFFKDINAKGAIVALWSGFGIGVFRLVAEFLYNEGTLVVAENSFMHQFLSINFLHFALILFLICSAILIAVSKASTPQDPKSLALVTFQKTTPNDLGERSKDRISTLILIALVLLIWWLFSTWGIA